MEWKEAVCRESGQALWERTPQIPSPELSSALKLSEYVRKSF